MKGKKILIIDDDPIVRHLLETIFSEVGAETLPAAKGSEGLRLLYNHKPDLIILDIMMPGRSGLAVCAQIRELTTTPIIMLTSLNNEETIVQALDSGAIDFVTKPFSTRVLVARAMAALRQAEAASPEVGFSKTPGYQDEYLSINLESRGVIVSGDRQHLTKTEFEMLALLVRQSGQVLTFERILLGVWGPGYEDSIDYVHSYMSRLRKKLEPDMKEPRYLLTEHGVGYRFQPIH
jgi:two-component system KDP operon response regulator KdpE